MKLLQASLQILCQENNWSDYEVWPTVLETITTCSKNIYDYVTAKTNDSIVIE